MARNSNTVASGVIHVRFNGRSFDIPTSRLDLALDASDERIKRMLAEFLDVPLARLAPYVIDRHGNGNLTLRPEAVFG